MLGPERIAAIVADKQMLTILSITSVKDTSVLDMCKKTGMSVAACYRKVNFLSKAGLIKCTGKVLTREGKRIRLYRATVQKIDVVFENARLKVKLIGVEQPEKDNVWNVSNVLTT